MAKDRDFAFDVKERYGVISTSPSAWTMELALISWNGAEVKYDIREWSPDQENMSRGITLTGGELEKLYKLLKADFETGSLDKYAGSSVYESENESVPYRVAAFLGDLNSSDGWKKKLTVTCWGNNDDGFSKAKLEYDIRPWKDDYSGCGRGARFTRDEAENFCRIIEEKSLFRDVTQNREAVTVAGVAIPKRRAQMER